MSRRRISMTCGVVHPADSRERCLRPEGHAGAHGGLVLLWAEDATLERATPVPHRCPTCGWALTCEERQSGTCPGCLEVLG